MKSKLSHIWKTYTVQILLLILWGFAWLVPWVEWLDPFPWVRFTLSLLIYMFPGMLISMFLARSAFNFITHMFNGIGFSIFIVGSLGILGRIFNLPFSYIRLVFAILGLVGIFILILYSRVGKKLYQSTKLSALGIISLLVLIGVGVIISVTQNSFGGDDYHYLTYLTSWQHAQPLSFSEVYQASGELDRVRYWLNMFPMNLAFLSNLSGVHGLLLIGRYLEPMFIGVSVLVFFNLFNYLLGSERKALVVTVLQYTFFIVFQGSFQFGTVFFLRLSEDKAFAAFILVPILYLAVHHFIKSRTVQSKLYLILVGWALALTHPILLAYGVFIASIYAGLVLLLERNYKELVFTLLIMITILLPVASLRFVEVPWVYKNILGMENRPKMPNNFDLESALSSRPDVGDTRITYIEGTPFYGLNPNVIKVQKPNLSPRFLNKFKNWIYFYIISIGLVWSLFNLRRHSLAPFVFASTFLIIISSIPYTGWLLGYLVTARMLWRAPWAVQIGLISYILLSAAARWLLAQKPFISLDLEFVRQNAFRIFIALCYIVIGYYSFFVFKVNWNKLTSQQSYLKGLENQVELGEYLEENIEQPVTFAARRRNMLNALPGLSSKSKAVYFQSGGIKAGERYYNKNGLIFSDDPSISIDRRIKLLIKSRITYLIIENEAVMELYSTYPNRFHIEPVGDFWVVKFRSAPF